MPAVRRAPNRASAYLTISVAVCDRVADPTVPVNVTVYVPATAAAGNVSVARAEAPEAEALTDAGETAHVLPGAAPLQASDTAPVNPFMPVTVIR